MPWSRPSSKPTPAEAAILSAVRWGHLTVAQAAVKLGQDRVSLLSTIAPMFHVEHSTRRL